MKENETVRLRVGKERPMQISVRRQSKKIISSVQHLNRNSPINYIFNKINCPIKTLAMRLIIDQYLINVSRDARFVL